VEGWTRFVLRHRFWVIAVWVVVLLVGGWANSQLGSHLSNTFRVPGTDSERARTILTQHFHDRSDGSFILVAAVAGNANDPAVRARFVAAQRRGAAAVANGHADPVQVVEGHVLLGPITSTLDATAAKNATKKIRAALGKDPVPGAQTYLTGAGALAADLDPIFNSDLARGESIALPIALLVLLLVFGLSFAIFIPFLFAACTIVATLGSVFVFAHFMDMAIYVTNLVTLIGLGIAIDYSLLIVYRFREEVDRHDTTEDAIVRTMGTAGRAVVFSGATVAIGLGLLLFMPLPFMQSMGVGGFLIPLFSILAAVTIQPVLLSLFGKRGTKRHRILRGKGHAPDQGAWAALARSIMRRPVVYLVAGTTILLLCAAPVFGIELTPGSNGGTPTYPESLQGYAVMSRALGPGALGPSQVVIHARDVRSAPVQAAIARLAAEAKRDPEIVGIRTGTTFPYVDATGQYAQLQIIGRHEYGATQSQDFARRLRSTLIPAAAFPDGTRVLAGGGPPQGVDFLHQTYSTFPYLVIAVLILTYVVLMRAFRSWLLPLKAVILNLLSVSAAYGLLVLTFQEGWGHTLLGHFYEMPQIEGWIPVFLFAMLFGLSMDYEVFLVSRMRETWDETHDNVAAVTEGLQRTGVIVTAAGAVMVAAFCGFVAGRVAGLQEFGFGLAIAILVDVTIVRGVLVPSLMALFGRYNWWLPRRMARVVRTRPSPLVTES
jgi:RND superfamily putative drug exporter